MLATSSINLATPSSDLVMSSSDLVIPSPNPEDVAPLSQDLPDELIHEILFRLPPDEHALLVRLSILSKPWHRLLSNPSFHQRYRKLHRKAPMLGFLYNEFFNSTEFATSFVPATKSCPPSIPGYKLPNFDVKDCRHGHVLGSVRLFKGLFPIELMVWKPMTGHQTHICFCDESLFYEAAAVLCPSDGCDPAKCHDFHVVLVGFNTEEWTTTAYMYWSETGEWSVPTPGLNLDGYVIRKHSVLVGGALYFLLTSRLHGTKILKYDVGKHRLSLIEPPATTAVFDQGTVLMAVEDGMLGIGHLNNLSLCLWTRKAGPDGTVVAWTQDRVIDLAAFLPIGDPAIKVWLITSVEGGDIIFAYTALGVHSIDLKLLQARKLRERQNFGDLYPFKSFYCPLEWQSGTNLFAGDTTVAMRRYVKYWAEPNGTFNQ